MKVAWTEIDGQACNVSIVDHKHLTEQSLVQPSSQKTINDQVFLLNCSLNVAIQSVLDRPAGLINEML